MMAKYLTLLCVALLGHTNAYEFNKDWGYANTNGWPNTCVSSTKQSGIEIDYLTAGIVMEQNTVEPMRFSYYDQVPISAKLTNIGHTLKLTFNYNQQPQISGGGLSQRYNLTEIHFRWGAITDVTSTDHQFKQWPSDVEIQLIHVKSSLQVFSSPYQPLDLDTLIAQSYGAQDTFAILSVHMNAVNTDNGFTNQALKPLFDAIPSVTSTQGSTRDFSNLNLRDLLPRNTDSFLRYDGSFTFPNCTESVIWTIFKSRIMASYDQLNAFSQVQTVSRNYRPKQNLNSRTIRDIETGYRLLSYGTKSIANAGFTIAMTWTAIWRIFNH